MGGLQVIGELAEIGYDAEWRVVSAAGLGAPHRRDRIIIVAYPNNTRNRASQRDMERKDAASSAKWVNSQHEPCRCSPEMEHATSARCETSVQQTQTIWSTNVKQPDLQERSNYDWWETEPNVGRVADGISNRVDRLRGIGNAVVPQVAEYIGHLVMAAHNNS